MSRNHNSDKKPTNASNNRERKASRYSSRYRSSNNQNGHITEDERLLRRPTQPLVSPTDPVPQEQVKEEEHALDRALHLDFTLTDPWRVFRIMSEFVDGFDALAHVPPSVAIFGSARLKSDSSAYQAAEETARLLAKAGFGIITGGGPGIMEAANKGAQEEILAQLAAISNSLLSKHLIPTWISQWILATSLCAKLCLSNTQKRSSSFLAALARWMNSSRH